MKQIKILNKKLKMEGKIMKDDKKEEELPILCSTCAWRAVCVKKFSFDSTTPIKCPDYSPDPELIKKKRELESDKKED